VLEFTKLLSTLQGKIIAGVVVTALAAGTGVAAVETVSSFSASDRVAASRAADSDTNASARTAAADRISGNGSGTVGGSASASAQSGPGTSASAGSGASAPGTLGSAGVNVNSGIAVLTPAIPGSKPVGPGGTVTTPGGTLPSGSVQAPAVNTPAVPSAPAVEPEIPGLGIPVPAAPSATTPTGLAVYENGTYSVVVPGTAGDSQQLCLSGTLANKCRTVKVPPTKSVTLTISYSGNVSAPAPTFTVNRCDRGLQIGVNGLTPGSTVNASAEGSTLSANLTSSEVGQTASFCKG